MFRSLVSRVFPGLSLLVLLSSAWAGPRARPVKLSDLEPAIAATTLDVLRAKEGMIPAHAFHAKMKAALESPLHLKQTFPGLLGVMVKPLVGTNALPGKVVPIGFDAHIENAGMVRLGKDSRGRARTIATLIDVDDSGVGPAGVDAISIGTALAQAGFGQKVMKKAF